MMTTGLLWHDDSGQDLAEKVKRAVRRYRRKFGAEPDTCCVHPSALPEGVKKAEIGGVQVAALRSVLRHHFWIGVAEPAQRGTGPAPTSLEAKGLRGQLTLL